MIIVVGEFQGLILLNGRTDGAFESRRGSLSKVSAVTH